MSSHSWFYVTASSIGTNETIGPVSDAEMVTLAKHGKVTRDTLVHCPSRKQAWFKAEQISGLLQAIEQGELERKEEKARKQQEAVAKRQAEETARQIERDRVAAIRAQEAQAIAQISDCKDIALVKSIGERVQGILVSGEVIQYITVQQKPLVNISPDAVIATNRRLIFYRPRLLGQFSFDDYQWFDLFNAHLQQHMMSSVFMAQHTSGRVVSMDWLSKAGAQTLYRLAQEREEQARAARHQLHIDTMRASAAQVNVQTHVPAPSQPAPAPTQKDDPLVRLEKLKAMADRGLISVEDFEKRKLEILSEI